MAPLRLVPFTLALALASSSDAAAKCVVHIYSVTGRVAAGPSAGPLARASIVAFANGGDDALSLFGEAPAVFSGPDGTFTAHYRLNTYSGPGLLVADRCKTRLRSLEIVVSHADPRVRARRFRFKGPALRVRPGRDRWTFVVDLPVLEVWRAADPPENDGV